MRRISGSAAVFLLLLLALPLGAQIVCSVKAVILESGTDTPLEGVKITLIPANSTSNRYEITTDEKGYVYKGGLPHGSYELMFEKAGYIPLQSSLRLSPGEVRDISTKMEKSQGILSEADESLKNGIAFLKELKYKETIDLFTRVIDSGKANFLIYFYRGFAREKSGNIQQALLDYEKTLELKPDFLLALSSRGKIHALQGDFAKALQSYKKAYELQSVDSETLYNYSVCLINSGDTAQAKTVLEKLISLDAGYSDAWYQLGIVHLGLGDMAGAKELLQKFITLDPQNPNAKTAEEILRSL